MFGVMLDVSLNPKDHDRKTRGRRLVVGSVAASCVIL